MAVSFECITQVNGTAEELFDRSRDVTAHTLSMARSRETAIAGVTTGLLRLGEQVTWRAWHFGIPLRMTNRITHFDAPHTFTDEQIRGPFRYFHHQHVFEQQGATTTMTDRVAFAAPFGYLGRLAEQLVLARYLRKIIEERNIALRNMSVS